jgi:hypothetical protein
MEYWKDGLLEYWKVEKPQDLALKGRYITTVGEAKRNPRHEASQRIKP